MPGHIGSAIYFDNILEQLARLDITEVTGLDDFHLPQGIIEEGRQALTRAFGVSESYFLVNGASSGIHALFLALSNKEKDTFLISRNVHKSVFAAMVLADVIPEYIKCQTDSYLGITVSTTSEQIENVLSCSEVAKAVFITNPSYYGTVSNTKKIFEIANKYNKPLLVDEAHGAHFYFHSEYPTPSIDAGAYAAVNGLHKSLPVLNQGACIHVGENFKEKEQLFSAISLLTTTSPSYPILASIDLARNFIEKEGQAFLDRALKLSIEYKRKISSIKGIHCITDDYLGYMGINQIDPLKVVISPIQLSINGYELATILYEKYNIHIEMAEPNIVVAMFSLLHTRSDWSTLYKALKDIARIYYTDTKKKNEVIALPLPKVTLSPRAGYRAASKKVKLNQSINKVSAEIVTLYPPGVPCLLPGETITQEIIDYITFVKKTGGYIQGPKDASMETIAIVDG